MRSGEQPQSMYTPIPQNMTDSDSEEDFRLQINNCQFKSSQIVARNLGASNMHTTMSRLPDTLPDVRLANAQTHYSNHNRLPSDADNVAILNANLRKRTPMSALRKICFIASIIVCIFTVILFVWILPCSDDFHSCPAKSERIHTHNWLRNYEGIELKGTINVVPGIRGRSKNLVFMYRRSNFFQNDDAGTSTGGTRAKQNGIISVIGASGMVAWYDELPYEPSIIDCNLIDADLSGDNDCLVIDEFGEMSCINPVSGQWIWHIAETNIPGKLNFPLILPDINQDGVKDLLIACTVQVANSQNLTHNAMKLISGANGRQIGSTYLVKKCSYIHRFQISTQLKISFNCIINDTDIRVTRSLREIYTEATNRTIDLPEEIDDIENQHKFYGQRKDTLRQRNIYSVNEKQLIVENYGVCPDSCNVTVTLLEEQKGKPKILRSFNASRVYGMVPARLSFNNSQDPSKPAVHGFVIKFWEWSLNETEKRDGTNDKRFLNRSDNFTEFNRFDYALRKKRSWLPSLGHDEKVTEHLNESPNDDDATAAAMKTTNVSEHKLTAEITLASQMRIIKETIVLIIFNSSDIRIENTSQSNIIQFCRTIKGNEVCQPELYGHQNSVLIADLDGDNDGQELVSYYSTFVENENEKNKWKLMTYVQLLRLESELPKLYAADEKH